MSGEHVAVVGAGAVGLSCALWLQRSGHRVSVIDPETPGSGTSSGNACTIADYACIPVNNPGLITSLPALMFSGDSPLSVDPGFALKNAGWLWRFLLDCRRSRVDQTILALAGLLEHTAAGLDPLLKESDSHHLINQRGCLYVYETRSAFDKAWTDNSRRRDAGVSFEVLETDDIVQLEPLLKKRFHRGLLFSGARQVTRPQSLMDRYAQTIERLGGTIIRNQVESIDRDAGALQLRSGERLEADRFVIASGAFSTRIRGAGLEKVPLGTERGYHVQYAGRQNLLNRPVGWAEGGFYATPTSDGLRFAGTVEIASLDSRPNQANLDYLSRRSKEMFDLEEQASGTWLGFRPTLPDALPVIDRSDCGGVLYAFGHQHIGLTLSGITGKLIAELVNTATTSLDLSAFSADRFG